MADESIRRIPFGCYVYRISVSGIVRYVGKGTGSRAYDHQKVAEKLNRGRVTSRKILRSTLYTMLAKALREGATVDITIVSEGMSDDAAYALEVEEIAGQPIGRLWNETVGGDGFSSEYQKKMWSDPERRERLRQVQIKAWQDNPEWRKARFLAPDSREKQREMMKAKWSDPEYRAMQKASRSKPRPNRRGSVVPALSAPAKARWADNEFRDRVIAAMKKSATPERCEAISIRKKREWADPDIRLRYQETIRRKRLSSPTGNAPSRDAV